MPRKINYLLVYQTIPNLLEILFVRLSLILFKCCFITKSQYLSLIKNFIEF